MLKIYSDISKLTAARDTRTLTGLLLPYGEKGYTNKGTVIARRGALTCTKPEAVFLNVEHELTARIGRMTAMADEVDGLHATFSVIGTRAGDDALLEASEGLRASLSIEIDNPVIRSGELIGGDITGAALVTRPAFASAVLTAAMPDTGELDEESPEPGEVMTHAAAVINQVEDVLDQVHDTLETEAALTDSAHDSPNIPEKPLEEGTKTMNDTTAARAPFGTMTAAKPSEPTHDTNWLLANLTAQTRDNRLYAALADVVPANVLGLEQPQYVGELWDGRAYERKIIPLFNHADLSSWKVQGWRWKTRPTVGPYTGNKAEIPSASIATEAVEIAAKRIAGGHDIDRKFKDFPDAEFWAAYFAAMVESYARVSDTAVLTEVKTAATTLTPGTGPNGIAQGLVNIVDGAISILNETDTVPTAAVVSTTLWRDIVLTPQDNILGYLNAAMSLEDGTLGNFPIIPSAALAASETLVIARDSVTVHELAGSPIRVEAIDVNKGGLDSALFGYYAVNIHDKGGLALVSSESAGA